MNQLTAQLRPSKVQHHIKKLNRLCTCCRQPYHTIRDCQDPSIYQLQLDCERSIIVIRTEIAFRYWLTHFVDPIVAKALCLHLGLARTLKEVNTGIKAIELLMEAYWHFEERQRQLLIIAEEIDRQTFQRNLLADMLSTEFLDQEQEQEEDQEQNQQTFQIGVYNKEYPQLCQQYNIECIECPVCYKKDIDSEKEEIESISTKNINIYNQCGHQICTDCFKNTLKSLPQNKDPSCAICRHKITKITAPTDEESTKLFQIVLGLV